jgi:hypothetical protein
MSFGIEMRGIEIYCWPPVSGTIPRSSKDLRSYF